VAGELILDTGPLVALIDRGETRHQDCVEAMESWTGTILSTEAVLTEALHLLGPSRRARDACLDFFLRGAVLLTPASLESLARVRVLMEKYADLPMDYADATLVALAEDLGTDRVFTLDRRGLSVFRASGTRPFHVIP
jgi:predicted nucleic acid-binding protein